MPPVSLPNVVPMDQLLSDFQNEIIDLLQNDIGSINYFGLVPNITADGVLFRFDVPQTVLGIDMEAEPHLVRKAFLNIVEKYNPSGNTLLEERGETKVETTVVFEYYHL